MLPSMFDLEGYLKTRKTLVDKALEENLPAATQPPKVLHEAMRYSVLAGGKRVRPILCMAAAEAVGGDATAALLPAVAIEILHTYTLIHDDLPAMDNDEWRRGKPTCHVTYGEANAILAGDALLSLAFELLAQCPAPSKYEPGRLVAELARAAGSKGVIGGQCEDLAAERGEPDAAVVESIHLHKTAALIRASTRMGAIVGEADSLQLDALHDYGEKLGLAFQIADDVLNETSDPRMLGKAARSDRKRSKMTYVAVYGVDQARAKAEQLAKEATICLSRLKGCADPLVALAHYVVQRRH